MKPTREDLIELGYLKPGDAIASIPKHERKIWLTESDQAYANQHNLTNEEMKDFKRDMIIDEEIILDRKLMIEKEQKAYYNSAESYYQAW
ncbi:hypothetical protein N9273_00430 [bacterium]|nr:hypothetical protein [bacterium]